ncbi:MAG: amino acid adenylation domain-containing protein [Candidatus Aminicenantes bacterium]
MKHVHLVSKISRHSLKNPEKVAITCGGKSITYLQLHQESSKIAHFLHDKIKSVKYVLIILERSPELIISILGILRCGLIFVPIDPRYPENRLQTLFKEVEARWLITTTEYKEKFRDIIAAEKLNVLLVDEGAREWDSGDITFDDIYNKHCYIYFTSGSTGTPKGVLGRHRSLLHYIEWEIKEFAIDEHFKVSQLTSPSFDPFLRDIFVPLAAGGTCCIPGNRETLLDRAQLIKWLDNQRVNLIHIVPSLFKALTRNIENAACLFQVRYILLAGELVRGNDIKKFIHIFRDRIQLVNICGPTETTLAKLFYRIKPTDVNRPIIPVGRPIADTQVMVLDSAGKKCLSQNVGEVYIRTPYISSGYFNDRELTKQVFIKNPYSDDIRDIVYKTGDLGRITLEGNLELVGRKDSQVKIRGVRVELGEIEDLLLSYDGIIEAVVLADEDDDGMKFLAAYLVVERDITVNNLRIYLAKYLSEAMIPSHFMRVEKIPLNPNGKVDREALRAAKNEGLEMDTTFVAPETGPAKIIADAWQDVLKVNKIGIHDNFFDLGGNSMHLIQVNSRLKETLKRDIPVVALLANPTISELTRYLREGEERIETGKPTAVPPGRRDKKDEIAVIGMAGKFPGAENIETFWENLKSGVESISHFSDRELEEGGTAPGLLKNLNYVKAKGVLEDFANFDASFFDYSPREAEIMDPQLRLLHECAWTALEDAGYNPDTYDGSIGCYSGAASNIYWMKRFFTHEEDFLEADRVQVYTLNSFSSYGTRIAYKLNLTGPSFPVHTGCSTSLVTIHLACQGLLNGECDMALAGGVSLSFPPKSGYIHQEGMIQSPDGHCRAFDSLAKGTVFGDAVGLVVLKPLEEALADGDTIHAVIKGSAVNNDGKRRLGYTAPSTQGQADVIRDALDSARVEPESIGYIETHGTGTALGDPNEIEALKLAFKTNKKRFCKIATAKTNLGHLNVAAGVTGFIKTVLSLKHHLIPPNLHFKQPNPEIDFANSPFIVNTVLSKWERQENNKPPLRAGVSSFGIGGTNAHVILEEAPAVSESVNQWVSESVSKAPRGTGRLAPLLNAEISRDYQLIVLSAKTETALEQMTSNLAEYFKKNPNVNFADAAYTLLVGRKAFNHRRMLVCSDVKEAIESLSNWDTRNVHSHRLEDGQGDKPVVFMFPGQGSQYMNMGLELYQTESFFREQMNRCFEILEPIMGYDIKEILYPQHPPSFGHPSQEGKQPPATSSPHLSPDINQTEIAQPLLFVFEYALAQLLMKWGIKPYAMIGYSLGEYVAACLAGIFSLEDALKLVVLRSRLIKKTPTGAMLSVPLPWEEIKPLLGSNLSIAIDNGPSCIISGPNRAIDTFEKQMNKKKYLCMRVQTSHAIHSMMMEPILKEYEKVVGQVTLKRPRIPYISNVTGEWLTVEQAMNPGYWANHLRKTVRFADGIKQLLKNQDALLIEVGPSRDLGALVSHHLKNNEVYRLINMVKPPGREVSDMYYLLNKLGTLWQQGVNISWPDFYTRERRRRVSLPTYSFEGHRFWIEDDYSNALARRTGLSQLPKNLKKADMADWFYIPSWKRAMNLSPNTAYTYGQSYWLVFMDSCGLGEQLVKKFEANGQEVVLVRQGTTFSRLNHREYTINVHCPSDYDILFKEIKELNRPVNKIIHLWGVTKKSNPNHHLESIHNDQGLGFYSLLYLAKAIGKQNVMDEIEVEVVTDNMQDVTGEEVLCPGKAMVLGPIKVIPQEYSHIRCRSIDLALTRVEDWEVEQMADCLQREFSTPLSELVVAYRGRQRWVQAFEPTRLPPPPGQIPKLREGGVYLVTGGLGNIGYALAKYLVGKVQAKLVLVGRTALPPEKEWDTWLRTHREQDKVSIKIRKVKELKAMGGEVLVFAADAADREQMLEMINRAEERFQHLNGIIHAAGILGESIYITIADLNENQCKHQFHPKVDGLPVLQEICRNRDLDFCLLTSSLSPILGGLGFAAYSAANQFMDSFVHYHNRNNHVPWISVNWADWKFTERKGHLSLGATVVEFNITPEQGIETFQRILFHGELNQVIVTAGDLQARLDQWVNLKPLRSGDDSPREQYPTFLQTRPNLLNPYTAPSDKLEDILVNIWKDILGYEQVGVQDDFLELGGDSLKAIIVVSRIHKEINVMLPLVEFFNKPTIRKLAKHLKKIAKSSHSSITLVEKKEYYELSSAQKRMYIVHQMETESKTYNISGIFWLIGTLNRKQMAETFKKLIRRHESLRTSFSMINHELVQVVHENVRFEMEYYNLAESSAKTGGGKSEKEIIRNFLRNFDLSQPPLLRVGLIEAAEKKYILMVNTHHIISDGTSMRILMKDFKRLYSGGELAKLKNQYKDFSEWQNRFMVSSAMKNQEEYWFNQFKDDIPVLRMPLDYSRPSFYTADGSRVFFEIDRETTRGIKQLLLETKTTLYIVLLAVYNILLSKYSGQEDIVIGTPIAGRRHTDLGNIIGLFSNMLAIRNQPQGENTFIEFLESVKVNALKAFENQDYQFENLVWNLKPKVEPGRNPLFDTVFALQVREIPANNPNELNKMKISPYPIALEKIHYELLLQATELNDKLLMTLEYSTELFKELTACKMLEHYLEILKQILKKRDLKLKDINISHDLIEAKADAIQDDSTFRL